MVVMVVACSFLAENVDVDQFFENLAIDLARKTLKVQEEIRDHLKEQSPPQKAPVPARTKRIKRSLAASPVGSDEIGH